MYVIHSTRHYKQSKACHLWHTYIEQDSQSPPTLYPLEGISGYKCKSLRLTPVLNPRIEEPKPMLLTYYGLYYIPLLLWHKDTH